MICFVSLAVSDQIGLVSVGPVAAASVTVTVLVNVPIAVSPGAGVVFV